MYDLISLFKTKIERILPMCLIIRRAKPFKKDTFFYLPKYISRNIKYKTLKTNALNSIIIPYIYKANFLNKAIIYAICFFISFRFTIFVRHTK